MPGFMNCWPSFLKLVINFLANALQLNISASTLSTSNSYLVDRLLMANEKNRGIDMKVNALNKNSAIELPGY